MTSWDTFLEALALELQESVGVDDDESEQVVFERVLRSRLLPLQEAGQALRDFEAGVDWRKLCPKEDNCLECDHLRPLIGAWDAAVKMENK